jgi:hypothetical protein
MEHSHPQIKKDIITTLYDIIFYYIHGLVNHFENIVEVEEERREKISTTIK